MSRGSQPVSMEAEAAQPIRPASKRVPSSRAPSARASSARTSSARTTSARPPSGAPNDGTMMMMEQQTEQSQEETIQEVDKIERLADLSIGAADIKKYVTTPFRCVSSLTIL